MNELSRATDSRPCGATRPARPFAPFVRFHLLSLRFLDGAAGLIGGSAERKNIDVVRTLCAILNELRPRASGTREALITFVKDRPGTIAATPSMPAKASENSAGARQRHSKPASTRRVEWYVAQMDWVAHSNLPVQESP